MHRERGVIGNKGGLKLKEEGKEGEMKVPNIRIRIRNDSYVQYNCNNLKIKQLKERTRWSGIRI